MLDLVLKFLKDELNTYLLTQTGSNLVKVEMSKLVDDTGKYAFEAETIGVSVINIEEERIFKSHLPEHTYTNGQHVVLDPELKLNLYVLFAANFKQYDQALKYISYVLTYFQTHPAFTSEVYPALASRIHKLSVELQSLNYEQLNQVWAFVGAKYLPSVIYKVRMVALQDETAIAIKPALTKINTNLHSQ
ncbi:MAG TPA: DUF4255 domain-containing protein [Cyanobacteria bacterium UBA8803]|nr:DUF4255 domain-containing protein [Cyanobacteria bacterium UBA9273]HBL58865.1 DUF4255 domain-containing protein [Cyanobacteria bacterium UBA8803]